MDACRVIITYFLTVVLSSLVMSEILNDNNTAPVRQPPLDNISKIAEGGAITINKDTTHMGREHFIQVNPEPNHMIKVKPTQNTSKVNSTSKNETVLPPFEIPEKNDDKQSVPRKGVNFTDAAVNKTSTVAVAVNKTAATTIRTSPTTVKPKKKKPTVTEADDVPAPPVKVEPNRTINHGIGIEAITEKQKKPDYVVPIVVVILLVPLVAIIISVLYKRGAEWWQHRHYRRMDFLIEGMYNN